MKVAETSFAGLFSSSNPRYIKDTRGFFLETYNKEKYWSLGMQVDFVQDNMSFSSKGVLRGLHYQLPNAQAKLLYVLQGEVWDVVVDIRSESEQFRAMDGGDFIGGK